MDQAAERLGYENTGKLLHWFALIYSTFISWAFFFFSATLLLSPFRMLCLTVQSIYKVYKKIQCRLESCYME